MNNLPNGWQVKSLGEVALIASGQGAPQGIENYSETGNPFIRAGSLEKLTNGFDYNLLEKIEDQRAKKFGLKLYPEGSVLLAKSGMSSMKDRVILLKRPSYVVSHLSIIIPNETLFAKYLVYFLRLFRPSRLIKDDSYPSIRLEDISQIELPLPPLPIQKQIAKILEKADQAKQKRKEANKLTDEFLQSVFIEMFGDPVKNPKGWVKKTVEEISIKERSAIKCGPFGSQLLLEELKNDGIPVYGIDNVQKNEFVWAKPKYITEDKYKELKSFSIKPNDVLISRTGTVGRVCLAPENIPQSIIGPNLLKVTLDDRQMLPMILSFAINYSTSTIEDIKQMSPGATVPVFNTTNLRKLKIFVPPLPLQQQFAEIVNKTKALKEKQKQSEQELENLFQSLMQRAFRGELVS